MNMIPLPPLATALILALALTGCAEHTRRRRPVGRAL